LAEIDLLDYTGEDFAIFDINITLYLGNGTR